MFGNFCLSLLCTTTAALVILYEKKLMLGCKVFSFFSKLANYAFLWNVSAYWFKSFLAKFSDFFHGCSTSLQNSNNIICPPNTSYNIEPSNVIFFRKPPYYVLIPLAFIDGEQNISNFNTAHFHIQYYKIVDQYRTKCAMMHTKTGPDSNFVQIPCSLKPFPYGRECVVTVS